MKKIVKNLMVAFIVLAAIVASGAMTSSVSAQGSGVFCPAPNQDVEVDIGAGIDPVAFCKGLGAGNGIPVCKDGTEVPIDVTNELEFCVDHGGPANAAVGGSKPVPSSNSGTGNCSATEGGTSAACTTPLKVDDTEGKYQCGKGDKEIKVIINIGCRGESNPGETNPIWDMAFALMRFLIAGIGVIVIGSVIYAGILYSASQGNPQQTQTAIKRIQAAVGALLLYVFAAALINWLVPGGLIGQ